MLLFFLILHIFLCKRNKGNKHIVLQDEENKLIMKLVENTGKWGKWRRMCDFSQAGGLLCIRGWPVLAGKACTGLILPFSGHSLNSVSFLSPMSTDGAVKILLFRKNSGQPWHFQSNSFPWPYQLVTANTVPLLTWRYGLDHSWALLLPGFNLIAVIRQTAFFLHLPPISHLHSDNTPDNTSLITVSCTRTTVFPMTHLWTFWDFRANLSTKNIYIA